MKDVGKAIHRGGRLKHKTRHAYKYAKRRKRTTSPPRDDDGRNGGVRVPLSFLIAHNLPVDLYTRRRRHNSVPPFLLFYDLMAQVVATLVFISPQTMLSPHSFPLSIFFQPETK
jgi:hypothetical protein